MISYSDDTEDLLQIGEREEDGRVVVPANSFTDTEATTSLNEDKVRLLLPIRSDECLMAVAAVEVKTTMNF